MQNESKKRTAYVTNKSVIMTLDGILPKKPVSVAREPWLKEDQPEKEKGDD